MNTTNMYYFDNQSTAVLRRWRKEGDVTDIPRALINGGFNWLGSDRYVEDASFVRFRTITARYTFPKKDVVKMKMKTLKCLSHCRKFINVYQIPGAGSGSIIPWCRSVQGFL